MDAPLWINSSLLLTHYTQISVYSRHESTFFCFSLTRVYAAGSEKNEKKTLNTRGAVLGYH